MNNPWLEILNRKPSQDGEQQESASLSPPEKQYRDWYWKNALKMATQDAGKNKDSLKENIFGVVPEQEFQKVLMRENLTGYPQEVEKTNEELDFLKKKLIESGASAGPSVDYSPLMALTSGSNSPSVRRVSENYLKSVKPDEPMQYLKNALSLSKDKLQNKQESLAELSKFLHANIQQLGTYQQGGGAPMRDLPPPPKSPAAPKAKEVDVSKLSKDKSYEIAMKLKELNNAETNFNNKTKEYKYKFSSDEDSSKVNSARAKLKTVLKDMDNFGASLSRNEQALLEAQVDDIITNTEVGWALAKAGTTDYEVIRKNTLAKIQELTGSTDKSFKERINSLKRLYKDPAYVETIMDLESGFVPYKWDEAPAGIPVGTIQKNKKTGKSRIMTEQGWKEQ